ncbi:MAG: hypothetical protein HY815_10655 [Candidatus Riflebacteria bacterium]|nr:hypothetical protein [Candidatus Riflebacteria bacterium]
MLGFIIPNYDGYRKGDRCRLVNLKTGTVVHQIEHGEYWTDLSHGGISPSWKRDPAHPGGWHCVVEFFGKWQPRNVTLLEIGPGSRCVETDIWALVESDTARRFRGTIPDRSFNDYYAFMLTETQIQWEGAEAFVIKAILDSNPKDLTDKPKHSCQVTARYDVRRHSLKVTTGKLEVRKAPPSGR